MQNTQNLDSIAERTVKDAILIEALDGPHAHVDEYRVVKATAIADLWHFTDAVKGCQCRSEKAVSNFPASRLAKVGKLFGEIAVCIC
jgi:hypothetical protein